MKNIKTKIISFVTSFLLAFTFVSLLPEGMFTASALTTYNLQVYGTQVTDKNAADILGDGAASYDSGSKTLTFKKDIKGKDYILKNEIKGLTINDKAPNGMAVFGGTGAVSDRTVDEIISVIR